MKEFIRTCMILFIPYYRAYHKFKRSKQQGSYFQLLLVRLGIRKLYWPTHRNCVIANGHNISVGINCLIGRSGNYLQGAGGIEFGNYIQLAQNVGVLSANHNLYNQKIYDLKKVKLGDYCWVGMNSVILPGVELGPRTIVAAGSVVTKSFTEGFCVIGGNPAKVIKNLEKDQIIFHEDHEKFYGYIPKQKFENKWLKKSQKH